MFAELEHIAARPRPFEAYTADAFWADPHISERMLAFHLDESVDISSRKHAFIDRSVQWMAERFRIGEGARIADFGCGPGLGAIRLARLGALVTGLDVSPRSIAYARDAVAKEELAIDYQNLNYLGFRCDKRFDLIVMIMCDFCALSPDQRRTMLDIFHDHLTDGGAVLLDVYSLAAFAAREEGAAFGANYMDGFWSAEPYFAFHHTYKYEPEKLALDKYDIIEHNGARVVYNWLQYFSPETIEAEFAAAGLRLDETYANVAGDAFDPAADEFAAVALKA